MTGFIARTGIPFGPLTVTFGYGVGRGVIPPRPGPPEPPRVLANKAGPSLSGSTPRPPGMMVSRTRKKHS